MGRYADLSELKSKLHGVNLAAFSQTAFGGSTDNLDRILEDALTGAEAWADTFCERDFQPLAKRLDTVSGRGTVKLLLRHFPVYDVQQVSVRYDPLSVGVTFGAEAIRIDREHGLISLKPSFVAQAAFPMASTAQQYPHVFSRGVSNVVVQYRTGYAQIGDNVGVTALAEASIERIATITTDATYAYFTCCEPFSPCAPGALLSTTAAKMLKAGVDNSSSWTMVTNRQLRCPIANYSSSATFVLVYVPAAVGSAVVEKAGADILRDKGAKSHPSAADGAVSVSSGPFKEDYGEMQYAGQIRAMEEDAKRLLKPFLRMA